MTHQILLDKALVSQNLHFFRLQLDAAAIERFMLQGRSVELGWAWGADGTQWFNFRGRAIELRTVGVVISSVL